jgi:hypothetical protein
MRNLTLTVIDRLVTRLGPRIDQHAHFRLEHPSDGVEQPPMRIDLLFVFLFEHKDDLDRDEVVRIPWKSIDGVQLVEWVDTVKLELTRIGMNELRFTVHRNLSGVLRFIERFSVITTLAVASKRLRLASKM